MVAEMQGKRNEGREMMGNREAAKMTGKTKKAGATLAPAFIFVFLLLIFLPSFSFARIFINQPQAGQMLEVLVEGEPAPANVTLIRPDDQSVVVALENGQMSYNASEAGRWVVLVGEQEFAVVVSEPQREDGGPQSEPPSPFFAALLVVAALILIGLIALAVDALIVRPPPRRAVVLEKNRQGNSVSVRLRAGSRPLRRVRVEDEVGHGWTSAPMRMSRQRLETGQTLEMEYEWTGEMGEVKATFAIGRHAHEMGVRSGRVVLDEEGLGAPAGEGEAAGKKEEMQKERRKLSRIGSSP